MPVNDDPFGEGLDGEDQARAGRDARPPADREASTTQQLASGRTLIHPERLLVSYVLNTPDDQKAMLAAIGVSSVEDLFANIPPELRLEAAARHPAGAGGDGAAAAHRAARRHEPVRGRRRLLPRRRRVRPLHPERRRCRRRPRRVLHRVHALPGRGQPGHAAGGLRVPDADVPAHRPGRRQRQPLRGRLGRRRGGADGARRHRPHGRGARRRERSPRVPADARDLRREPELPRADAADAGRVPEPGRRGEGGQRSDRVRDRAVAELLRPPRRDGGDRRRGPQGRRGLRRQLRSDQRRPAEAAGRLRRGHRRRRGAGAGRAARLRRAVPRHPGLPRRVRVPAEDPRPARRPDDRPQRQALLGADAADARAAHPPREGDEQHLHEPGAARAAGGGLPGGARAAGAEGDGRTVRAEGALRGRPS